MLQPLQQPRRQWLPPGQVLATIGAGHFDHPAIGQLQLVGQARCASQKLYAVCRIAVGMYAIGKHQMMRITLQHHGLAGMAVAIQIIARQTHVLIPLYAMPRSGWW